LWPIIPDNWQPKRIAKRSDLIQSIQKLEPSVDFSDPSWGSIENEHFSIELNMGDDEDVHSFTLHVRGGDLALGCLANILTGLELKAADGSGSEFFDLEKAQQHFSAWREFRDQSLTRANASLKSWEIVFSLIAIALILVLPHLELFPNFGYIIPIAITVRLVLYYSKQDLSHIGLSLKNFKLKALPIGLLFAVLSLAFMQGLFFPILESILSLSSHDLGLTASQEGNLGNYLFFVLMAWLVGGIYEEIVFHGFIFTRLEAMIGGKQATLISFIVSSALFGLYHFHMGALGLINAWIIGMGYLGLFIRFKRNLWYSIMAHGFYNTLVMSLIYGGYL